MTALALLLLAQIGSGPGRIEVDGAFVEPLSQVVFPLRVEKWQRTEVRRYPPPPSSNHSITYELRRPGGNVRAYATCYVYSQEPPLPATLETHFETTLDEIAGTRRDFELVKRSPLTIGEPGRELDARWAMFLLRHGEAEGREPVVSQLFLLKSGAHWIKWRVTNPATEDASLGEDVLGLVGSLAPGAPGVASGKK